MLKRLFEQFTPQDQNAGEQELQIERVSAVLLAEIARSDHSIDAAEQSAIVDALAGASKLPRSEIDSLVNDAIREADALVCLYADAALVNELFDKAKKIQLIEQMWRVALADGRVDHHEEHTIRKLADLIYVKHRDFMQAKHRVLGL